VSWIQICSPLLFSLFLYFFKICLYMAYSLLLYSLSGQLGKGGWLHRRPLRGRRRHQPRSGSDRAPPPPTVDVLAVSVGISVGRVRAHPPPPWRTRKPSVEFGISFFSRTFRQTSVEYGFSRTCSKSEKAAGDFDVNGGGVCSGSRAHHLVEHT
jgi:hypothetical protein